MSDLKDAVGGNTQNDAQEMIHPWQLGHMTGFHTHLESQRRGQSVLVLVKQPPAIHIQITEPCPFPAFSGTASDHLHDTRWGVSLSPQTQLGTGPSSFRSSERVSSAVCTAVQQRTDSGPQTAAIGKHSWGRSCVRTCICPSRKMSGNCSHGKPCAVPCTDPGPQSW